MYSNMSREEWQTVRSSPDDRSIAIKKIDKRASAVVWDRSDYLLEAGKQLSDTKVYRDVTLKIFSASYKMFSSFKNRSFLTERKMKYFTYEFKKPTNFGKPYLLPKIHERLHNIPGRAIIPNSGSPEERCFKFLDHHLKLIMRKGWSHIKDPCDFLNKNSNLGSIPSNAILVTANVVELYSSILHEVELRALR